jgi:hypothetical protein
MNFLNYLCIKIFMTLNEIKKLLYKEDPLVRIAWIGKEGICYEGFVGEGKNYLVFLIPYNDIGDAKFLKEMSGKYLIRWLINYDN